MQYVRWLSDQPLEVPEKDALAYLRFELSVQKAIVSLDNQLKAVSGADISQEHRAALRQRILQDLEDHKHDQHLNAVNVGEVLLSTARAEHDNVSGDPAARKKKAVPKVEPLSVEEDVEKHPSVVEAREKLRAEYNQKAVADRVKIYNAPAQDLLKSTICVQRYVRISCCVCFTAAGSPLCVGDTPVKVKLWILDGPWNCLDLPHDVLSDADLSTIFGAINTDTYSTRDTRGYLFCKYQDIGRYTKLLQDEHLNVALVPYILVYPRAAGRPVRALRVRL